MRTIIKIIIKQDKQLIEILKEKGREIEQETLRKKYNNWVSYGK